MALFSGCRNHGILVKRESEMNCPTDIRQMVPWCVGEDAVFRCPAGPNEQFHGHKPTCWRLWQTSGAEWRDMYCAPLGKQGDEEIPSSLPVEQIAQPTELPVEALTPANVGPEMAQPETESPQVSPADDTQPTSDDESLPQPNNEEEPHQLGVPLDGASLHVFPGLPWEQEVTINPTRILTDYFHQQYKQKNRNFGSLTASKPFQPLKITSLPQNSIEGVQQFGTPAQPNRVAALSESPRQEVEKSEPEHLHLLPPVTLAVSSDVQQVEVSKVEKPAPAAPNEVLSKRPRANKIVRNNQLLKQTVKKNNSTKKIRDDSSLKLARTEPANSSVAKSPVAEGAVKQATHLKQPTTQCSSKASEKKVLTEEPAKQILPSKKKLPAISTNAAKEPAKKSPHRPKTLKPLKTPTNFGLSRKPVLKFVR